MLKSADADALLDQQIETQLQRPKEYFEMVGNRYMGEGRGLQKAEAIVLFLLNQLFSFLNGMISKMPVSFSYIVPWS
jgi:hypothetical protein